MAVKYYWEDLVPGRVFETATRSLSEEDIVRFAREYDPQTYHTDAEAARHSPYGGLIASGWHTAAVSMRLMCDGYLLETSCVGSPGLEELRWLKPVRPGDTLRLKSTVLESTPSARQPNRGTVLFLWEILNQHGEVVLSMRGRQLFLRRAPA
ncbi:MAG: MaoC family dehydratase [Burkholderiales bacterium]